MQQVFCGGGTVDSVGADRQCSRYFAGVRLLILLALTDNAAGILQGLDC